jgi:2-iminoacetate synthase
MFRDIFEKYDHNRVRERILNITPDEARRALAADSPGPEDFYALLSPAADGFLEELAQKAFAVTRRRFGNTIQLYAPLYVSNECSNSCLYCGFNCRNSIARMTLTPEEVDREAELLYRAGFRHILLVSGEHRGRLPVDALAEIGLRIHRRFSSVSIEVYPMETSEYALMAASGVDGLTLYQETYDREVYAAVHPAGKKRDFNWRLDAPDRGGAAGLRKLGVGSLLGLTDWRVDGFFTALHAHYLTSAHWRSAIQVSFPRLRYAEGAFPTPHPVSDRDLTHLICAMRVMLPDAGLALSTRETPEFRDNMMPLGITMMSAGSKTEPGGYSNPEGAGRQFEIEDPRPPEEIAAVVRARRLDPVWKDWDRGFLA